MYTNVERRRRGVKGRRKVLVPLGMHGGWEREGERRRKDMGLGLGLKQKPCGTLLPRLLFFNVCFYSW